MSFDEPIGSEVRTVMVLVFLSSEMVSEIISICDSEFQSLRS